MSQITEAVEQCLKESGWQLEWAKDGQIRTVMSGRNGHWLWLARWEDDGYFTSIAFAPVKVPPERRPSVAEYLMRANWGLHMGNFEMDFRDGEVTFRVGLPLRGGPPSAQMIDSAIMCSFFLMDRYLPGLLEVVTGKCSPRIAVKKIEDAVNRSMKQKNGSPDDPPPGGQNHDQGQGE